MTLAKVISSTDRVDHGESVFHNRWGSKITQRLTTECIINGGSSENWRGG